MRSLFVTLCILLAAPLAWAGDAIQGEVSFRECKVCHSIIADDGTRIQRGGMVGPNLYGLAGRRAAQIKDFRYSPSLVKAGELGLVWTQEEFTKYLADPMLGYLRSFTNDPKARGRMGFQLEDPKIAADIWAYLVSVAP